MKRIEKYWQLFSSSFYLSAFTFGGGYVIIPLLQKKFVDNLGWISNDEMMDMTAIAQSAPGSLAVNASILIGYKIAGISGALVCTLGTVLPPLILLSVISRYYDAFKANRYIAAALHTMQAGVAAVILDVVMTLGHQIIQSKNIMYLMIMVATFTLSLLFQINALILIIVAGLMGVFEMTVRSQK